MQKEITKKTSDKSFMEGIVTFTKYLITGARAKEIDCILKNAHDMESSLYEDLVKELASLCPNQQVLKHNIVVLTGRAVIARILIGDTTYTGTVNYGALGTSSTAVSSSDTQLGAEVARKLFARRTRTNAVCNFDFFYSQADTDGTYQEFGVFIDGSATANSGQLFNHVLTGGWVKTDQEALTVSIQFNINQS